MMMNAYKWGSSRGHVLFFFTYAGFLCSMSGSDYPPHCLICLSVSAVSSLWCFSAGLWPLAQTTVPVIASSLTSGLLLRPFGWALPWPSLCLGCREQELIFSFMLRDTFRPFLPYKVFNPLSVPFIYSFNRSNWKVTLAVFQTNTLVSPTTSLLLYPCVPPLVQLEQMCCWMHRAWSWQLHPVLVLHSLERKSLDPGWWSLGRETWDQRKCFRSNVISFNQTCC